MRNRLVCALTTSLVLTLVPVAPAVASGEPTTLFSSPARHGPQSCSSRSRPSPVTQTPARSSPARAGHQPRPHPRPSSARCGR
jgi:hypothetical protein